MSVWPFSFFFFFNVGIELWGLEVVRWIIHFL